MPMRELRSCDFCGGDAAGVYEVLPPELSPTEAEQRRLVLCSNCAGTLETVVDPLLERLGVETGSSASGDDAGSSPSGAVVDEGPSRSEPATSEARSAPETTTPEPDDAPSTDDAVDPNRSDYDSPVEPDDSADSAADRSTAGDEDAAADGAVQWNQVENGDDLESGNEDDPDEAADPEPAVDSDGSDESSNDHADGAGGATADRSDEPEDFRTVMRLLANREFPVERGAIVDLAANAYDLDEQHVNRIIDHAVDRGVITDDGRTLRRN